MLMAEEHKRKIVAAAKCAASLFSNAYWLLTSDC
jgi:hypothetical protein